MEPVKSTEATTCSSNELFAPVADSSGRNSKIPQGVFSSLLKTETCTASHNTSALLPPHYPDNKERISIFGKPPVFPFRNTTGCSPSEVTPFQVKAVSTGSSIPLTATVSTMSSNKCFPVPEVPITLPQLPEKSHFGLTPGSSVSPFASSPIFTMTNDSVGNLFQPSKVPIAKLEKNSFSFAETFKKETEDKSSLVESQPEQQGVGIFGRSPAFSFSSAAANITTDKAFDCSMSSDTVAHSPSKNLVSVSNTQVCEEYSNKAEIPECGTVQQRSPTISSLHVTKDDANVLERRTKYKRDFSTSRIRKKSKDDESKVDSKSSKLIPSEEMHQLTAVVCKGIHSDLNNRDVLYKHFSKFGLIKRINCSIRYNHAIITFSSHEAAKKAKMHGGVISSGFKPAEIFWSHKSSKLLTGERKSTLVPEVNQELQSMMEIVEHDILDRPPAPQSSKSPPKKCVSPGKRNEKPKLALKDSRRSEKNVKSSKIIDSTEDSLKKLLEMAALTEEDKYRVLDARDKLIRLNLKKQPDISRTKAIVGTCPDICSEKERYSRFEKNCLSIYEQKKTFDPAVSAKCLDHRIIVKEYSRSSADKEEPLPHEIRPTNILSLTMDHLMCNIANKVTDSAMSVGEWYDFIWNRTRAIRKDITQQDLCNIDCVKLVEKCVRFHIHCAAALCDEDMSIFDRKINDENLTKSLQTLKHMYHDLGVNGIKCPNEAEFRAYDILLSLNEGDTLRQAQNFSSEIRDSPEVRFAVCAAFAMNSNNYIRFFKLVEEASYMNACIMHRYFTPVRVRALQVMLKAYCLPNHTESYPLEELVSILKFEHTAEASQFCQWLKFQTDENYVQLDRMSFGTPSSSSFQTRSINLVEKKRCNISVGEVMNKRPLPVNPLISYEPHCSFDSDGYLKKEASDASDQRQKAEQCDKIVISIQCEPAVSKQSSVMRVTKPVVKKSEIPADSSSKQTSPSNFSTAVTTSQLCSSSAATVVKQDLSEVSDPKDLLATMPLFTSDEKEDSCYDEVPMVQKSADIVPAVIEPLIDVPSTEEWRPSFSTYVPGNFGKHATEKVPLKIKEDPPSLKSTINEWRPSFGTYDSGNFGKHATKKLPCKINEDSPSLKPIIKVAQYAYNIWKQLSSEVLQDFVHEIVAGEIALLETEIVCTEIRDSVVKDVVKDLCFEISYNVVNEVVLVEMEQKEKCASALAEEIVLETVQEHVSNFIEHEYAEVRARTLDTICSSVMTSILDSCIGDMVVSVSKEVYSQEMKNWKCSVQTAKRKTQLQQARKALVRWQRAYVRRRKLEICRDTFPCSPQVPLKMSSVDADFGNVVSGVKKEKELSKLLDAGVLLSSIKQELSWLPLDLSALFEKHFPKLEAIFSPDSQVICWKLLLMVPESCSGYEDPDWISFIHWLCAKFSKGKCENICQDGVILCDLFPKNDHGYHVDICVRVVLLGSKKLSPKLDVMKKKRFLEGTSAILLVMPHHEVNTSVHEEILTQVQQIIDIKRPFPPVPLYCFLVGSEVPEIPSTLIQFLNSLKKSFLLSNHEISVIKDTTQYWKSSEKLLEATAWLIKHYNGIPKLITCSLKNFVEDCFLKIFSIVYEDLSHISPRKMQNITKIIYFYNAALNEYIEAVCSPSLSKISWPPPEMITHEHVSGVAADWNELNNLNQIRSTLGKILLPEFQGSVAKLEDMWTYAEEVANIGNSNSSNFFSSIKSFLMKTEQTVHNSNFIPWCDVLYDCAHYLISCQSFMDESTKKEVKVTYVCGDIDCLDLKSKWEHFTEKGNETMFNDKNSISIKKRKHSSDELSESSVPGNSYPSDVHKHAPVKYARNDKEDEKKETTFEDSSMEDKIQHEQTYQQRINFSMSNFTKCFAEENSLHFMEALEAEKCQSESYLSLLEAKVAEGQEVEWINEGALDETFLEEYYAEGAVACSPEPCNNSSDYVSRGSFSELCLNPADLHKSVEAFESSLVAQVEANKSFERRLRELCD